MIRLLREWREHHALMRAHAEHQSMLLEEVHYYLHVNGLHPRVSSRLDRSEHRTPTFQPTTGE